MTKLSIVVCKSVLIFFGLKSKGPTIEALHKPPPRNLAEPLGIIVVAIVVAADADSIPRLGTKAEKPSKRNHFL